MLNTTLKEELLLQVFRRSSAEHMAGRQKISRSIFLLGEKILMLLELSSVSLEAMDRPLLNMSSRQGQILKVTYEKIAGGKGIRSDFLQPGF